MRCSTALPLAVVWSVSFFSSPLLAQDDPEEPAPAPQPQQQQQAEPQPQQPAEPPPPPREEEKPAMSEGRLLTSLYNSGFRWGISPGVVFSQGKAGFFLGLSFGYGVDLGPVILTPGLRLSGYFTDPNVYIGMPTFRVMFPIDRFGPFIQGGTGVGYVTEPSKTGLALMGGGGFMIYFRHVAFGAEASYQVITNTGFSGFGVGPILAIGF